MSKPKKTIGFRDRIKDFRRVPANQLAPNPKNFREHPEEQLDAIRAVLDDVGFAGAHLARELPDGSLMLIDGHARASIAGDAVVPVLVLDVTEAEADKILATFDPLSAMAEVNTDALNNLIKEITSGSDSLNRMLADMASAPAIDFSEPPDTVMDNATEIDNIKKQRREANKNTESKNDTEKYLIVVYESRQSKEFALKSLGLPLDERYVPASSVSVKPRGLVKRSTSISGRSIKAATPENSGAGG